MTKTRIGLLAGVVLALAAGTATVAQTVADGFLRYTPDTLKWFPYPGLGGTLGVQEAILFGDPAKPGLYVVRIKFPPHVMSRPHSHPEDRFIVVLKGTWWTGTSTEWEPTKTTPMKAGDAMLHPHGAVHYDGAREEETIIQLVGVGPSSLNNAHPGTPDFARF